MDATALLGLPSLAAHLPRVEEELRRNVRAMDPFLSEVGGHLLAAGGKRLRPALAMAAAAAGDAPITSEVVRGGVSVELVHIGSLYHDDVMDEAESRRGVESVNHRWGNLVAILAGDFLLARASEIAASLGTEVAALLARTIGRLCEGQVGELRFAFNVARPVEEYLASIGGKTASLTAAACRIGALVSALPDDQVEALTDFGHAFGMAFQIRDDVLDVVGEEKSLGKPTGLDLIEGTYTLPVLRALAHPDVGEELRDLLGRPVDRSECDQARALVRSSGGVEEALAHARGYADQAAGAVHGALDTEAAAALAGAAHALLDHM